MDRFIGPVALPPIGQVGVLRRGLLVVEILATYARLVRRVRSNDIRAMVSEARSPDRCRTSGTPEDGHETAVRLGHMVSRTLSVLPTDQRCLIRSLVTIRVLERRSIPSRAVIGINTDAGFFAHAWVEHEGEPVLPAGRFTRLLEL